MINSTLSAPSESSSTDTGIAPAYLRRLSPLFTVIRWELRRLTSTQMIWISALLVFVLTCLLEVAISSNPDTATFPSDYGARKVTIDWLSNYGLFHTLPTFLGLILALFIPFLCTDGVARDLKRGAYELIMTTALPSWAYVWGRYLCCLLLSLGVACVMLLGILTTAVGMRLFQPDIVLTPDFRGILFLWAVIFLPPVLIISGVSFGLGTLFPRFSNLIKVVMLLGWFLDRPLLGRFATGDVAAAWDPTSQTAASIPSTGTVLTQLARQTQHATTAMFLVRLHAFETQLPDVSSWIIPRLIWVSLGIAVVLLASLYFRRFRDARG
ncbi:MAG TPA: hypothetical protein VKQ36_11465 [Ktedonobacterales bacterium]|nr:hypothetical protein [Ktedonobacterales bacterium]